MFSLRVDPKRSRFGLGAIFAAGSANVQAIDQQELIRLRARLDELIQSGGNPDPFRVVEVHNKVVAFTKAIFSREPRIDAVQDAEFGDSSFVVTVEARGDVDELVALNDRWHRGIRDVAQELAIHYALSLVPVDDPK